MIREEPQRLRIGEDVLCIDTFKTPAGRHITRCVMGTVCERHEINLDRKSVTDPVILVTYSIATTADRVIENVPACFVGRSEEELLSRISIMITSPELRQN